MNDPFQALKSAKESSDYSENNLFQLNDNLCVNFKLFQLYESKACLLRSRVPVLQFDI